MHAKRTILLLTPCMWNCVTTLSQKTSCDKQIRNRSITAHRRRNCWRLNKQSYGKQQAENNAFCLLALYVHSKTSIQKYSNCPIGALCPKWPKQR